MSRRWQYQIQAYVPRVPQSSQGMPWFAALAEPQRPKAYDLRPYQGEYDVGYKFFVANSSQLPPWLGLAEPQRPKAYDLRFYQGEYDRNIQPIVVFNPAQFSWTLPLSEPQRLKWDVRGYQGEFDKNIQPLEPFNARNYPNFLALAEPQRLKWDIRSYQGEFDQNIQPLVPFNFLALAEPSKLPAYQGWAWQISAQLPWGGPVSPSSSGTTFLYTVSGPEIAANLVTSSQVSFYWGVGTVSKRTK